MLTSLFAAAACGSQAASSVDRAGATGDDGSPGVTTRGSTGDVGPKDVHLDAGAAKPWSDDAGAANMSDAANDAASCSGESCSPTPLICTTQPIGLAVSETTITWRTAAGNLMSAAVDGTNVATTFAAANGGSSSAVLIESEIDDLLLNASSAYFVVNAGSSSYVQASLLDGSSASALDSTTNIATWTQAIALDRTSLYVARYNIDPQGGSCPDLGIDVVPLNGGSTTTLHGPCFLVRMTVDDSQNLYWTDRGRPPGTMNPSIMMQSATAATPTKLASATSPYGIVVFDGSVYFTDAGKIMVLRVGSANATTLSSSADPRDLVVDASGVYWIDSGSAVMRAPLAGGEATPIARGQANVVALATNSTSVFWADEGTAAHDYADGAIMRVAK